MDRERGAPLSHARATRLRRRDDHGGTEDERAEVFCPRNTRKARKKPVPLKGRPMDAIKFSSIASCEKKEGLIYYGLYQSSFAPTVSDPIPTESRDAYDYFEDILASILTKLTNRNSRIELSGSWQEIWDGAAGLTDRMSCRNRSRFRSRHYSRYSSFSKKTEISALLFRAMLRRVPVQDIQGDLDYTVTIRNEVQFDSAKHHSAEAMNQLFVFHNYYGVEEFIARTQDLPALQSAIKESFLERDVFIAPIEFDFEE